MISNSIVWQNYIFLSYMSSEKHKSYANQLILMWKVMRKFILFDLLDFDLNTLCLFSYINPYFTRVLFRALSWYDLILLSALYLTLPATNL